MDPVMNFHSDSRHILNLRLFLKKYSGFVDQTISKCFWIEIFFPETQVTLHLCPKFANFTLLSLYLLIKLPEMCIRDYILIFS